KPGVAPLDVDAERHDRGDQAEIDDAERDRPALRVSDANERRRHDRKKDRAAGRCAHITFPLRTPVGRTSSTTTRITKETANLYSVPRSCTSVSGAHASGRR